MYSHQVIGSFTKQKLKSFVTHRNVIDEIIL